MGKSFLVTVTNDLNQDQRMHRICNALVAEGYEVKLIGRVKDNSSELLEQTFSQERLKCFFKKGFLFYFEFNIRLLFYVLRNKPDVIYSVDLDTLLGSGTGARLTKSIIIHDAHEYFVEVPELEGKRFRKWIWNRVGLSFVPRCDLCITVNEELAEILTDRYKAPFQVVRNVPLINDPTINLPDKNDVPILLYQGVLNKGRGLEQTMKAVCAMPQKLKFRIAGDGDLAKELKDLKTKIDTDNKIEFLGWLSPMELKNETQKADVGLNLLSGTSLNYRYSLANKFFDYMHARVPSINMGFPVYKRICSQYKVGLLIDSLDSDQIQDAILTLISDPQIIQQVKSECDVAIEVYNWEGESQSLLQNVTAVIEKN